ncbi:uncharacterized protein LOC135812867 [Sycon ciliatum]|uniref:uncharacterized protein LOC135812863 n=1 Tax=Sycon ciliatum TaxID=27933 RepID=UPI0031F6ACD7
MAAEHLRFLLALFICALSGDAANVGSVKYGALPGGGEYVVSCPVYQFDHGFFPATHAELSAQPVCSLGYSAVPNKEAQCANEFNGWNIPQGLICQLGPGTEDTATCALYEVQNGHFPATRSGSSAEVMCDSGYSIVTYDKATCTDNGWTIPQGQACQSINSAVTRHVGPDGTSTVFQCLKIRLESAYFQAAYSGHYTTAVCTAGTVTLPNKLAYCDPTTGWTLPEMPMCTHTTCAILNGVAVMPISVTFKVANETCLERGMRLPDRLATAQFVAV